jgi:hypothetical protein
MSQRKPKRVGRPKGSFTGTQATWRGQPTATAILETWMLKGRRVDPAMAERKWGIVRGRYHAAIYRLRGRYHIDSDQRMLRVTGIDGIERAVISATHAIIR